MSLISPVPRAPYALAPTDFRFPALATLAGRAPMGGPREVVLACLVVGRIVADAAAEHDVLSFDQLQGRIQGAKHWLGSAAIPATLRAALSRLAESAVAPDRDVVKAALDTVMTVTANQLDPAARLELARLAQAIAK